MFFTRSECVGVWLVMHSIAFSASDRFSQWIEQLFQAVEGLCSGHQNFVELLAADLFEQSSVQGALGYLHLKQVEPRDQRFRAQNLPIVRSHILSAEQRR